jgi:hypothetical protein
MFVEGRFVQPNDPGTYARGDKCRLEAGCEANYPTLETFTVMKPRPTQSSSTSKEEGGGGGGGGGGGEEEDLSSIYSYESC